MSSAAVCNPISRRTFVAGAAIATAAASATTVASVTSASAEEASEPPTWLGAEPDDGEIAKTLECDLLIVGAGNAGMSAAATASDEGVDFLLAEAFDSVQDTRHWIGAVNSRFTYEAGVEVDVPRLQYELARYASFKCNQRVHKMWIDESAEMVEWLEPMMTEAGWVLTVDTALGGEIEPTHASGNYIPPVQHMFIDPQTMSCMQTELPHRNEVLLHHIEAAGNGERILWNHELVKLVHADGTVTGAIFSTDEGNVQVNASKGVVLATGGYSANHDMLAALAPVVPTCTTTFSASPKCKGVGIKAGIWAGGVKDTECAPMIFDRGPVVPGVKCGFDETGLFPASLVDPLNFLGSQPFMKVALDGRRFVNESCPYDFTCFAAAQHEGGVWCSIMDGDVEADIVRFATDGCSKVMPQILASGVPFEALYGDLIAAGLMIKADSIEELAEKIGFAGEAKDTFLAEVERYNGFYDEQVDEDFAKPAYRLSQLRTPPFYAQWFGGTLLTTCDGLRIDENMRVIDADCRPIEGLFAVGDCSGSYFSGNYPEYIIGAALGRTLTEGRHVVRKVAGVI